VMAARIPSTASRRPAADSRSPKATPVAVAEVSGAVRDSAGSTVAHATVTIAGPVRQQIDTDPGGRYRLTKLPRGVYTLSAGKPGLVSMEFGQHLPFEPAEQVVVGSTGDAVNVDFVLPVGGAVSGVVRDERGQPVPDVAIRIWRQGKTEGEPRPLPTATLGGVRSDSDGKFRLVGVPEGSYLVSGLLDRIFVESDTGRTMVYPETFAPHSMGAAKALPVRVVAGRETTVLIQIAPVPSMTINGLVIDSSGNAALNRTGMVRFTAARGRAPIKTAPLRADGTFSIDVASPDGDYVVAVSLSATEGAAIPELGKSEVRLRRGEMAPLIVRTNVGATVTGRLEVAGSDRLPSGLRVFARPVVFDGALIGSVSVPVANDGTFALRNVFERSRIVVELPSQAGLEVRGVRLAGADVTETGILPIPRGTIGGVTIALARPECEVVGHVRPLKGATRQMFVLVFPQDEGKWADWLERYVKVARTDSAGQFRIDLLFPGSYFAIALPTLDVDRSSDASFLRELRSVATPIKIAGRSKLPIVLGARDPQR